MAHSVKKGDIIFQLTPFVHALNPDELKYHCSCCVTDGKLFSCGSCKVIRYCSAACQKADWKTHKMECRCLRRNLLHGLSVPSADIRLLLRILIKMKNGETKEKSDEMHLRSFDDLESHYDKLTRDLLMLRPGRFDVFNNMFNQLAMLTMGIMDLPDMDTVMAAYGRKCTNAFALGVSNDGRVGGVAIYLSSSILNHSCEPNAVVNATRKGIQQVRAMCDFTYDDYSGIKVSYIDLCAPSEERNQQLQFKYYFTCKCVKCTDPTSDQKMTSTVCPTKGCKAPISQTGENTFAACSACGNNSYPADYLKKKEQATIDCKFALQECKKLYESDDDLNIEKAYQLSLGAYNHAQNILHQHNVYMFRMLGVIFTICTTLKRDREAIAYGRGKIAPLKALVPEGHPSRCVAVLEVAEVELRLGNHEEALDMLEPIQETMYVMWGEDHPQTQLMDSMIRASRRALGKQPRNTGNKTKTKDKVSSLVEGDEFAKLNLTGKR